MNKRIYHKTISWILKPIIKAILKKYQPKIIGVTGSVGKTSAKEAIFAVLRNKYRVRRNVKNFNTELGLPLTILGFEKSGGKNIFSWIKIYLRALRLLLWRSRKYPEVLVLEMGADRPGDIHYLTSIAKPDIAVITLVGTSHIEFFGSIENIAQEKASILKRLNIKDWAVINGDDSNLAKAIKNYNVPKKTFGENNKNDVSLSNVRLLWHENTFGTHFKIHYQGAEVPIFLPNILGAQHAMSATIACTVGLIMGMNLVECADGLQDYVSAPGRAKLLPGVKKTWLIDDSYNASPQSMKVALEILRDLPNEGRKIAVLADMLELGHNSEIDHRQVGQLVVDYKIDYLFIVGERSRDIARGAIEAGMSEDHIYHFPETFQAGIFLQERLKMGDVILIKGSRGMKMEQIVYEIMARPWDAEEFLVGPVRK